MSEWIEWKGGDNPVPGEKVEVKLRSGTKNKNASDWFNWGHEPVATGNIIAYRVAGDQAKDTDQDMVNHPDHYQSDTGVECIDAIRAALGKEGFIAYCRGNAIKYCWRDKDNLQQDLQKAEWYLKAAAKELTK